MIKPRRKKVMLVLTKALVLIQINIYITYIQTNETELDESKNYNIR